MCLNVFLKDSVNNCVCFNDVISFVISKVVLCQTESLEMFLDWREALISNLVRLLDTIINNLLLPQDWKRASVIPIYKGVVDH
jgi:hypothetical protein